MTQRNVTEDEEKETKPRERNKLVFLSTIACNVLVEIRENKNVAGRRKDTFSNGVRVSTPRE